MDDFDKLKKALTQDGHEDLALELESLQAKYSDRRNSRNLAVMVWSSADSDRMPMVMEVLAA